MDRFEIDEKTIETLKSILKRDGYNFREINPQKEEGGVFGIDENGNKIRITDSLGAQWFSSLLNHFFLQD